MKKFLRLIIAKFRRKNIPVSCGNCGSENVLIHVHYGDHLIDCVECRAISVCRK